MGSANGPGFASTFTTDNMEDIDGDEEDNVFEDNTGKEEEEEEEENLSDMQVYLYFYSRLYSTTTHSTPALI